MKKHAKKRVVKKNSHKSTTHKHHKISHKKAHHKKVQATVHHNLILMLAASNTSLRFWLKKADAKRKSEPLAHNSIAFGSFIRLGTTAATFTITSDDEPYSETVHHNTHQSALRFLIDYLHRNSMITALRDIIAVVHRMPHGGRLYTRAQVLHHEDLDMLLTVQHLSPDLPGSIRAAHASMRLLAQSKHIGVFDTGFFAQLPPAATLLPIDPSLANSFGLVRWGSNGIMHKAIHDAGVVLCRTRPLRVITILIDDEVSVAAATAGSAKDTTSGFTAAEGLPGLHRAGSLDPRIPLQLASHLKLSARQTDALLNQHAGIAAIAGKDTWQQIIAGAHESSEHCVDALMLLCYRITQAVAGMVVALGGVDLLVFSGSADSWVVREEICRQLSIFGVVIGSKKSQGIVSASRSKVKIAVVAVREEDALLQEAMFYL